MFGRLNMRYLKIAALLLALFISFGAGALTAGIRNWFQPLVTVHISNLSGLEVSNLSLISKTGSTTTTMQLRPLSVGEKLTARFFNAGEGSYRIQATLSNGQVISGGAGYVESGYTTTELLHSNKIESRYGYAL